ncbi:MAG TPA: ABC transporter permease [Mycobacteriales bacterium]|nr:ABC transporter permease [Mycobacteriales bacterium]
MTAATITRPRNAPSGQRKVTQGQVIASEWIKLRSLRSSWFTFVAAIVGMIGIGLLVSAVTNAHWGQLGPDERAHFDPVTRSLTGVYLAQLAVGVLGVLVISGEYATGMIRATFGAVPTRLPVLWAKLAVFAAVTFVLMLISSFVAFLGGQQLLTTHGTTLGAPNALRAVVGVALYLTVVGALGIALGFLIRSTAGGIATLFGLLLVLPTIGQVLPASWQVHILPYLPGNAGAALFTLHPDPGTLSPWIGFAVFCGWAAAALLGASVLMMRRDA